MRYLAIGDIHGCYNALLTLAEVVRFQPEDVLITLGDYVDRGPDSNRVVEWLITYARKHPGKLVALCGNHELMMSRAKKGGPAFNSWLERGGAETLASYHLSGESVNDLMLIPDDHWRFLEHEVRPYFETEHHFFVHANAYPDFDLDEQPGYMLYWERFDAARPHKSGKIMVCGHTSQFSGLPVNYGYAVCIDTRAYGGNWLTCLDIATGHYWQANQRGEVREGSIEDHMDHPRD